MNGADLADWYGEVESELKGNILPFWLECTIDEAKGGFYGEVGNDRTPYPDAGKSLVLNTRILWTFSAAYRFDPNPEYLRTADRAFMYLRAYFWDREHGGMYWMLDAKGNPTQPKKQVYGQAFAMYACSEYHRAAPNPEALDLAISIYRLLERHSYDEAHRGYVEALARDWRQTGELALSARDRNEKKSMNTHLHVLEAYTNLYRIWPSDELAAKLRELITVMVDHIVDPATHHFHLFFDADWTVKSREISYGHDIEGSWLLLEAAEALGEEAVIEKAKAVSVQMAEATYAEGLDSDGAVVNEGDPSGWIDSRKDWWPQAEAAVGFLNVYQLTGEERYLQASRRVWTFIDRHLVDKNFGEWYWSTDRDGKPNHAHTKVNAWKCPYHNGRACMEIMERLRKLTADPL